MSILSDLFAINSEDASEICKPENFSSTQTKWKFEETPGLSEIKLAQLLCILRDRDFSEEELDGFKAIYAESDEEGPWVYAISRELLDEVENFDEENLRLAAMEWLEADEVAEDNWDFHHVEATLKALQEMAKFASMNQKKLVLRICL
jgi:hypothetical protein